MLIPTIIEGLLSLNSSIIIKMLRNSVILTILKIILIV